MSKLSKFLGQSKEFDIEDLGKVKVHPLTVRDMALFNPEASQEEQVDNSCQIIFRSLSPSMPDLTIEEVKALPLSVFTALTEAINDVNGFNKGRAGIDKIKEQIAARKARQ